MARRATPRTIPLSLRLPNPPLTFVGRVPQRERLASLLRRGSVAIVTGPAGIGKSALVAHTLAEVFADRVPRTLSFAVAEREPLGQLLRTILHALASLLDREGALDLPSIQTDESLTLTTILDLAETAGAFLVVADVQHVVDGEVEDLVGSFASYARLARLIVTSTRPLAMPLAAERTIELPGLLRSEAVVLAEALGLGALDASQLVGSPLVLRQLAATGTAALGQRDEALLAMLGPDARNCLRAMALLGRPAPLSLAAHLGSIDGASIELLEHRGLLRRVGETLRVHDVLAEALLGGLGPTARREVTAALVRALLALADPEQALEAVRLCIEQHDEGQARDILAERGEGILSRGLAPRLFHALSSTTDPRLAGWLLRCGAELGNATALEALQRPPVDGAAGEGAGERLAWAWTRYLRGEPQAAASLAESCLSAASPLERRLATSLIARARLAEDRPAQALEALAGQDAAALEPAALRAMALHRLARPESHQVLDAALRSASLGEPGPVLDAVEVLLVEDRDALALRWLDAVRDAPRMRGPTHLLGRRAVLLRAEIAIRRGELASAGALLEEVRPFVRGASILRPRLLLLDAERRLALGELADLALLLDHGEELSRWMDRPSLTRFASVRARARVMQREPPSGDPNVPTDPPLRGVVRLHRARFGLPSGDASGPADLWAELADAVGAILSEEPQRAMRIAVERYERLRSARPCSALEAVAIAADAALLAHDEAAASIAGSFSVLAEAVGSPRWSREVAFHEAPTDLANLERLAADDEVAPAIAHRARALLGEPLERLRLDAVDLRVVAALQRRIAGGVRTPSSPARWMPGWGLDVPLQRVWLSDGRWIELAKKRLLFKLLLCVADADGASVDKEQLVLRVWNERSYHPGLHDAKLHVAVRALRKELEDDPAAPGRFVTTAEGYAIGGTLRRRGG